MTIDYEYALISGAAYFSQRQANNRIPVPEGEGWEKLPDGYDYNESSGFEAVAYRKGNEIVIAFAGTDQWTD
jgi:hypothetical protein